MIEIKNADCMVEMAGISDKFYDLAIVDPPYGMGDKMLTSGGTWAGKYKKGDAAWDIKPDAKYFQELFRISKNQIVWGGNYFELPPGRGFVIWDKVAYMDTLSDCEFAWTSFDKNPKIFRHCRNTTEKRIHICQKPIDLYRWLLTKYAKPGDKILDTHSGSGSLAIACNDLGFDLTAFEIDKEYYDASLERLAKHRAQGRFDFT